MITTLILDWGGVFTIGRFGFSVVDKIESAFNFEDKEGLILKNLPIMDLGNMSHIEFCNELNEKYQLNITKEKIEEIFEKSIKPNNEMIELLEHLHKKYRLIMLSNNHPPTIDIIKFKHKHLTKFFDKIYFSAELKMKKPNKEFFLHMIKDAKLRSLAVFCAYPTFFETEKTNQEEKKKNQKKRSDFPADSLRQTKTNNCLGRPDA